MSTRKFSRVSFQIDSTVTTKGRRFTGMIENLSLSGMLMVTDEKLPLGDVVKLAIILSGTSPAIKVSLTGRVSRVAGNGLGFTFEKIDPDSHVHLKKIIAYNSDDADKVLDDIHHAIDEKISAEK
jgi:hypothetical protein